MLTLSNIYQYPVKSMRGNALTHSRLDEMGVAGDRVWLLAEPDGTFITARSFPELLRWQAQIEADGTLHLFVPDGDSRRITPSALAAEQNVRVWKDRFSAHGGDGETDAWLSHKLARPVRLHYIGGVSQRLLQGQTPLSFADGAPVLLTHTASLDALNRELGESFSMNRFRANLVVAGGEAFAEESWQRIRIGGVVLRHYKPCTRCVLTTICPDTLAKHPAQQPLSWLAKNRRALFGVNLLVEQGGSLSVGDRVEILE